MKRSHATIGGIAVALVGVLIGVSASTAFSLPETPEKPAAVAAQPAPPPPPPAPPALQARLEKLAEDYGEPVGIAVTDVDRGWTAAVNGEQLFPQQSVSKLWVALTTLEAIDQGMLDLFASVHMGPNDRSVFYQPIATKIRDAGYQVEVAELLERALIESDNAANDMLIKIVGGVHAVSGVLGEKGISGIRLGADEKNLQSKIAGLSWRPEYGVGNNFKVARSKLPPAVRDAAMDAYLADPYDGAAPASITQALAALKRGELLSEEASAFLMDAMRRAETGPRRLKGGLPQGWIIGHKTGTGQDWRGASVGINDVGLITAPDGRTYAVAVLIKRTKKPVPARLAFMQQVSQAVVDAWAAEPSAVVTATGY